MRAEIEGLQALSSAVLSKAQSEATRIVGDAKSKAESLLEQARKQAETEKKQLLERAAQDAEQIRKRSTVSAQLKAQTMRLAHREKLLDAVFEAARGQLASVQERDDYDQIVRRLVRGAVRSLRSDSARVWADSRTRAMLTDDVLKELSGDLGVKLELGPELEHRTGVIAETLDGRRRYDNTLETRLERRKGALRGPVYRLLTGGGES